MATKANVLAQFTLKESDDERQRTYTLSDKTVSEFQWNQISLTSGQTKDIYSILSTAQGTTSTKRYPAVFLETDKLVKAQFITRHASTDLTTIAGYGNDIRLGGVYMAWLDSTTTHLWVTNRSTGTATVQVALAEIQTTAV